MPFIETILFDDDKKKIKKINDLISKNVLKVFKTKNNTITIYNNIIKKNFFYHNLRINNPEKRIFIKISGLKRPKNKKKISPINYFRFKKIIKVKHPRNIAVYFYDKSIEDIYHGS